LHPPGPKKNDTQGIENDRRAKVLLCIFFTQQGEKRYTRN
jgi:hypothetical protein